MNAYQLMVKSYPLAFRWFSGIDDIFQNKHTESGNKRLEHYSGFGPQWFQPQLKNQEEEIILLPCNQLFNRIAQGTAGVKQGTHNQLRHNKNINRVVMKNACFTPTE